ncbi:hypothetical protein F5888DRAFT_1636218 [Russula emetica]|nr:hypothetical protein F5888DRAFT_1636218 [Russula emetica]
MAHSTEKSHLITLLDKLADNPGNTEDEGPSSSDSESTSSDGNGKNEAIIDHVTLEPENNSIQILSPPPTVSQKPPELATPGTPKVITYVVSITSVSEAKKPATKRATKHATCQVQTNKPWSTLQAQLLVKVSDALKPKTIDFANYEALFYIPRLLSKPGMVLAGDADYQILLQRVASIKKLDPTLGKVMTFLKTG